MWADAKGYGIRKRELFRVGLRFWVRQDQIDGWFEDRTVFFMLAIGRSGTKLLSGLLGKAPGSVVFHEPVASDFLAYQRAFASSAEAMRYFDRYRVKEIYLRARRFPVRTYGEVNSLLRRHCDAIKWRLPNARLLHLIRDGRDVVRSMMSRKTFQEGDRNTMMIRPVECDPYAREWPRMDRFERICWYWQVENQYLRTHIGNTVRFEGILEDYDYFRERVLRPIGLEIDGDVWQEAVHTPVNASRRYAVPHWRCWSEHHYQNFLRICGNEMEANGYQLR